LFHKDPKLAFLLGEADLVLGLEATDPDDLKTIMKL
jgi:hypothetical protein